jgi:hypothetical protein
MRIADHSNERLVWLSLVLLTMLSWWLSKDPSDSATFDVKAGTTAIMLVGFFKARLVGMHFMELRRAPWILRGAFESWIVLVCGVILFVYWLPATT